MQRVHRTVVHRIVTWPTMYKGSDLEGKLKVTWMQLHVRTYPLGSVLEDNNGKLVLLVDQILVVYEHLQGILPHTQH